MRAPPEAENTTSGSTRDRQLDQPRQLLADDRAHAAAARAKSNTASAVGIASIDAVPVTSASPCPIAARGRERSG
jgi:hypothetical protein